MTLIAIVTTLPNFFVITKRARSPFVLPLDLKYRYAARNSARVSLSKLTRIESASLWNEGEDESL
jgi:homoserine kinase